MTSHQKMITHLWSFSFGFITNHNIWSFLNNTSHFEISVWTFDISFLRISLWLFGHHTFQYKSLSLFPSQILVCATAFATYYLFSFWDLQLLSSLSKNIKNCGKIYRHKSKHVSKLTRPLNNHSWKAWRSIYNRHIDFKIFPTKIDVHTKQAKNVNALYH